MLRFNSCWHYIFTDYPYLALKDRGFAIDPISDEMINGYKCDSLLFKDGNFVQELQFRELLDEEEFLHFQKQKGLGHDLLRPGVCFEHDSLNEEFALAGLDVCFKTADANKKIGSAKNENQKVVGLFWNLSANDTEYFCRRANLKVEDNCSCRAVSGTPYSENPSADFHNKKIKVTDDFSIYLADKSSVLAADFEARKDFPFWGVIIQTPNLKLFDESKYSDEVQPIEWHKQKAILLKHHIPHWDIILTELKG
jgi:hypothetical protein